MRVTFLLNFAFYFFWGVMSRKSSGHKIRKWKNWNFKVHVCFYCKKKRLGPFQVSIIQNLLPILFYKHFSPFSKNKILPPRKLDRNLHAEELNRWHVWKINWSMYFKNFYVIEYNCNFLPAQRDVQAPIQDWNLSKLNKFVNLLYKVLHLTAGIRRKQPLHSWK